MTESCATNLAIVYAVSFFIVCVDQSESSPQKAELKSFTILYVNVKYP